MTVNIQEMDSLLKEIINEHRTASVEMLEQLADNKLREHGITLAEYRQAHKNTFGPIGNIINAIADIFAARNYTDEQIKTNIGKLLDDVAPEDLAVAAKDYLVLLLEEEGCTSEQILETIFPMIDV